MDLDCSLQNSSWSPVTLPATLAVIAQWFVRKPKASCFARRSHSSPSSPMRRSSRNHSGSANSTSFLTTDRTVQKGQIVET